MNYEKEPLRDKKQTSDRIKEIVSRYAGDLENIFLPRPGGTMRLSDLSLAEFFDFVRKIPYRRDKAPVEVVSRPSHIVKYLHLGMDCKKKATLLGSFLKLKGIKFRFIGSSSRPDKRIHHIFPQGFIDGEWKNIDGTYPQYRLFEPKEVTAFEIL
jgi:hypothetical protein